MPEYSDKSAFECPFPKLYPSQLIRDDVFFMKLAYNQAIDGWREGEVPVGAVIEMNGEVVGSAYNQVELTGDPTAHAEILAISKACRLIGDWRLNKATLYVTKEPCPMCSGASIMSRFKRVVYAVRDSNLGCLGGAADLNTLPDLLHHCIIDHGILEEECLHLIQAFFIQKREKNKSDEVDER